MSYCEPELHAEIFNLKATAWGTGPGQRQRICGHYYTTLKLNNYYSNHPPKDFHVNAAVLALYDKHCANAILIGVPQGCKST